jgi:transcriptional regulator with XRE-family HTH domain
MQPEPEKRFGERVRELRERMGISQEALATRAGIHRTYVGGVERGERNLSLKNIIRLAEALNVGPQNLFEEVGTK